MPIKALFVSVYMTIAAHKIFPHLSYWAKHGHMAISVICYLESKIKKWAKSLKAKIFRHSWPCLWSYTRTRIQFSQQKIIYLGCAVLASRVQNLILYEASVHTSSVRWEWNHCVFPLSSQSWINVALVLFSDTGRSGKCR